MPEPDVRLDWSRDWDKPPAGARLKRVRAGRDDVRLIQGDNLAVLGALSAELRQAVTLAYLDPPFLTGRQHSRVSRKRDKSSGRIERSSRLAFDDRWGGTRDYLNAVAPRIEAVRDTLTSDGCAVIHLDSKTSHYVKVLCDEIFGQQCFASEIIWRYRRWPAKTPNFQRVHDVLLRYVKDADYKPRFNQLYEPLAASTLATWGKRKQRAIVDEGGRRLRSSTTASDTPGAPLGDVWEIGIVAPVARERTGYPTQKPEALLRRLIESLTDPGDCVLDPYAGSGTALVAAASLNRRVVGIDVGDEALSVIGKRLKELSIKPRVDKLLGLVDAQSLAS
jgi:DNA modification methylase